MNYENKRQRDSGTEWTPARRTIAAVTLAVFGISAGVGGLVRHENDAIARENAPIAQLAETSAVDAAQLIDRAVTDLDLDEKDRGYVVVNQEKKQASLHIENPDKDGVRLSVDITTGLTPNGVADLNNVLQAHALRMPVDGRSGGYDEVRMYAPGQDGLFGDSKGWVIGLAGGFKDEKGKLVDESASYRSTKIGSYDDRTSDDIKKQAEADSTLFDEIAANAADAS